MIEWLVLFVGLLLGLLFVCKYKNKTLTAHVFQCFIGKLKVTTLLDGYVDLQIKTVVKNGTEFIDLDIKLEQEALDLNDVLLSLARSAIKIPVNAYIVDKGSRVFLIDVGFSGYGNQKRGSLTKALTFAGYNPDQITDILITHLDINHIAGLLTKDGEKVFSNARLHIAKEEVAYWIYEQQLHPELSALITKLVISYALETFVQNQKLFEDVFVISTPGHSVGHSSFLFESEGKKLLISGDLIHVPDLQFLHPEISLSNNHDELLAMRARLFILEKSYKESILIAGAHLPFPGLGYVKKIENSSGYTFEFPKNSFEQSSHE